MNYSATQLARIRNPRSWSKFQSMKRRCTDPLAHNYHSYGGRGITVCPEWLAPDGFEKFVEHMGEAPIGLTLGRIDNSRGYGPGNVAWQTWAQQAKDRRKGGAPKDPLSLRQRALAAGKPYMQVYHRIHMLGWSEERALSEPIATRKSYVRRSPAS